MKHNHQGRAYRRDIERRLALYEARQPPFDKVPAGGPIVPAADMRREAGGGVLAAGYPAEVPIYPQIWHLRRKVFRRVRRRKVPRQTSMRSSPPTTH